MIAEVKKQEKIHVRKTHLPESKDLNIYVLLTRLFVESIDFRASVNTNVEIRKLNRNHLGDTYICFHR